MVNMTGTNYLERRGQLDSPALKGMDAQIYSSIGDYRGWRRSSGGLFITSGPTDTIMSISVPINKNHSEVGGDLRRFLKLNAEVQLIHDDEYEESSLRELFDMLVHTDGAANFKNGYLTAVKRYIEGVIGTGTIEGGARHKAAAYASTQGLMSHVLSEETGNITVFGEGKPILIDPCPEPRKRIEIPKANLVKGREYADFGSYERSGLAILLEGSSSRRVPYHVFEENGRRHRILADVVKKKLGEQMPTMHV
jgi:hypothetical protein